MIGRRASDPFRRFADDAYRNKLYSGKTAYPRYLSGFLHALEPVPQLADFVVEAVSNAFARLPDPVLLPWLPTLISTLRADGSEPVLLLIREAGRIFPGRLAALDAWVPPWLEPPAVVEARPTAGAGAGAALLAAYPATCDAVADLRDEVRGGGGSRRVGLGPHRPASGHGGGVGGAVGGPLITLAPGRDPTDVGSRPGAASCAWRSAEGRGVLLGPLPECPGRDTAGAGRGVAHQEQFVVDVSARQVEYGGCGFVAQEDGHLFMGLGPADLGERDVPPQDRRDGADLLPGRDPFWTGQRVRPPPVAGLGQCRAGHRGDVGGVDGGEADVRVGRRTASWPRIASPHSRAFEAELGRPQDRPRRRCRRP